MNKMTNSKLQISKTKNKGYILISVLVIMIVMLAIVFILADALFSELAISRNQKAATVSFNLAESGVSEAIWQIQNNTTTRDAFVAGDANITINHSQALVSGGSYEFNILSTAPGAASISSTGLYNFGDKTAQRRITLNVIQTGSAEPYAYDAALLVGGPNSGNVYLHNMNVTLTGEPASIASAGNISIGTANINVNKDILANGTISTQNSTVTYAGTKQDNYSTSFLLPGIDVSSDCPSSSYKCQAIAQNQYYTASQFSNLIKNQTTFNGIVYIAGSASVDIKNKNLTFNGLLVSEGTIIITNASVNVYHNPAPSGIITLGNLTVTNANLNVEGLVYVGVLSSSSVNANINITGAILAHDFYGNNANLTINFKKDWVNETLEGGGTHGTPVIEFDHWEEEY